jgi:hypothetical protein
VLTQLPWRFGYPLLQFVFGISSHVSLEDMYSDFVRIVTQGTENLSDSLLLVVLL